MKELFKIGRIKAEEILEEDRKSVVQGKSVDLGGRRSIKKKNKKEKENDLIVS